MIVERVSQKLNSDNLPQGEELVRMYIERSTAWLKIGDTARAMNDIEMARHKCETIQNADFAAKVDKLYWKVFKIFNPHGHVPRTEVKPEPLIKEREPVRSMDTVREEFKFNSLSGAGLEPPKEQDFTYKKKGFFARLKQKITGEEEEDGVLLDREKYVEEFKPDPWYVRINPFAKKNKPEFSQKKETFFQKINPFD